MNIALLTAGGIGNRMGQDIPKQFMTVDNCPVIIYTMLAFQRSEDIDIIAVVCLKGWEVILRSYANQYNVSKLKWIFQGGDSNQDSIKNGIRGLKAEGCSEEDIVLIHDGVRPLVSKTIISNNINTCKQYGYAVTGLKCKEVILQLKGDTLDTFGIPREELIRTQTPHTYPLGTLLDAYQQSEERHIEGTAAACDLFPRLGVGDQHWVMGSEINGLKLTNVEDIELFKAMLHSKKEEWIK